MAVMHATKEVIYLREIGKHILGIRYQKNPKSKIQDPRKGAISTTSAVQ
jgi:hypothetical protein